jgi:YbgC/YbaW family acyl-CoA thioester hydrolase
MTAPFRHPHRVSYAECTLGNHVYHSRYLDWLEAARGEFIRALGSTVLQWQERDVIFPVIEARLRYKSPARYDDLLAIEVWPTASSIKMANSFWKPKRSTSAPARMKNPNACRRNWPPSSSRI